MCMCTNGTICLLRGDTHKVETLKIFGLITDFSAFVYRIMYHYFYTSIWYAVKVIPKVSSTY